MRCSCSLFANYPLEYSRDWTVTGSGNYSHLQKCLWLFDLSSKWNLASFWLHGALLRNSSISNLEPVSCSGADSPNPKSNASLYRWFCVLPVLGLDLYFACVNSHALKYSTWNNKDGAWFYSEQQDLELTAEKSEVTAHSRWRAFAPNPGLQPDTHVVIARRKPVTARKKSGKLNTACLVLTWKLEVIFKAKFST